MKAIKNIMVMTAIIICLFVFCFSVFAETGSAASIDESVKEILYEDRYMPDGERVYKDYTYMKDISLYTDRLKDTGLVIDEQPIVTVYNNFPWGHADASLHSLNPLARLLCGVSYVVLDEEPIRITVTQNTNGDWVVDLFKTDDYDVIEQVKSLSSTVEVFGKTCTVKNISVFDATGYYGTCWVTYIDTDQGIFVKCYRPSMKEERIYTWDEFKVYAVSYQYDIDRDICDGVPFFEYVDDYFTESRLNQSMERPDENIDTYPVESLTEEDSKTTNDSNMFDNSHIIKSVAIICGCTVLIVVFSCFLTVRKVKKCKKQESE